MTRPNVSTPTPVGALLTAAVPLLAERLLGLNVRRDWAALMGVEIARRAQPVGVTAGTLTVIVDNSPWLQELTLREPELLSRLHGRYGADSIRALRFSLGTPSREPQESDRIAPAPGALTEEEEAWVARAAAEIRDRTLAETVRRLLAKHTLSRRGTGSRS